MNAVKFAFNISSVFGSNNEWHKYVKRKMDGFFFRHKKKLREKIVVKNKSIIHDTNTITHKGHKTKFNNVPMDKWMEAYK